MNIRLAYSEVKGNTISHKARRIEISSNVRLTTEQQAEEQNEEQNEEHSEEQAEEQAEEQNEEQTEEQKF